MISIHGQTAVYGIIGDPVAHSLSPLFQNYFLQQAGIDAIYAPFHVRPERLKEALAGLHAAHVQGLNVTVPHKETAYALVQADDAAKHIGAINTLKRGDKGWLGTNTDWQGFAAVLQGLKADTHAPALLFGAGGTAKAVIHALVAQGMQRIFICNRSSQRVQQLIEQTKGYAADIQAIDWNQNSVQHAMAQCHTIINTTSIGLNPQDTFPFALQGQGVAIDAVYQPKGNTAFTKAAQAHGWRTSDGLPMLIAQGIASFKFWHTDTGINLPDKLESLQWVEAQLNRQPCELLGWRG